MLYGGDVRYVVRARCGRGSGGVGRGVVIVRATSVARHECLEDLQEILEEVNVHEVGEARDATERGGQKRRRMRVFEHAEVQHEQELERLGVLEARMVSRFVGCRVSGCSGKISSWMD